MDRYLQRIKSVLREEIRDQDISVILFGSRATGEGYAGSDVDIALKAAGPIDRRLISRLHERLEESTIPYRVDLVDWSRASAPLRKEIDEKGKEWKL
jgi:hypothetical protein